MRLASLAALFVGAVVLLPSSAAAATPGSTTTLPNPLKQPLLTPPTLQPEPHRSESSVVARFLKVSKVRDWSGATRR